MKLAPISFYVVAILFTALQLNAGPRVALMNFSTDDNSYRSAQTAVDLTVLVQAKLPDVRTVEWVERSQLELAEKELSLAALSSDNCGALLRWGSSNPSPGNRKRSQARLAAELLLVSDCPHPTSSVLTERRAKAAAPGAAEAGLGQCQCRWPFGLTKQPGEIKGTAKSLEENCAANL